MAIYSVKYTKKNAFIHGKSPALLKNKNNEGDILFEKEHKGQHVPGAYRRYTIAKKIRTGKMRIGMEQEELNALVKKMALYDLTTNERITEAPLGNGAAPFWVHPELEIYLEYGGMTLNDEVPMDRFWLSVFKADPGFYFKGEKMNAAVKQMIQFTVSPLSEFVNERIDEAVEGLEAIEILNAMSYDKMVTILAAMGTVVRKPSNEDETPAHEKLVKSRLYYKITEFKDERVEGVRNIDRFLMMSKDTSNRVEMVALVNTAISKGIIRKSKTNKYYFGAVELGTSKEKVKAYLQDTDNYEVLEEITGKLRE